MKSSEHNLDTSVSPAAVSAEDFTRLKLLLLPLFESWSADSDSSPAL